MSVQGLNKCSTGYDSEFVQVRTAFSNKIHIFRNKKAEENWFPDYVKDISEIRPISSEISAQAVTLTCLDSNYFLVYKPNLIYLIERTLRQNYSLVKKKQKILIPFFGKKLFFQISNTFHKDFETNTALFLDSETKINIDLPSCLNFKFKSQKILKSLMIQNNYLVKKASQIEKYSENNSDLFPQEKYIKLLFQESDFLLENIFLWILKKKSRQTMIKIDVLQLQKDIKSSILFLESLKKLLQQKREKKYYILIDNYQSLDLEDEIQIPLHNFLQQDQIFIFRMNSQKKQPLLLKNTYEVEIGVKKEMFSDFLWLILGPERQGEFEKINRFLNVRTFQQMLDIWKSLDKGREEIDLQEKVF